MYTSIGFLALISIDEILCVFMNNYVVILYMYVRMHIIICADLTTT